MNSDTDKVLCQRQKDGNCIICGKNILENKILEVVTLHHFILGKED